MTFSIVARSEDGRTHGVAVASKFLSVGAVVPAAEADIGALATQSFANLAYRPQGLMLLRTGTAAADVVAGLTAADPQRASRQLGVVGVSGDGATFTGDDCHAWAGGVAGDGYAIQGNILTGPEVVEEMERAWLGVGRPAVRAAAPRGAAGRRRRRRRPAGPAERRAVRGGERPGIRRHQRRRGRPPCRRSPGRRCAELERLVDLHALYFDKPDPKEALSLDGPRSDEVRALLSSLGHHGDMSPDGLDAALASWAGVANLEMRLMPGAIDPLVLEQLRTDAAA